jgi:hypothetical protein
VRETPVRVGDVSAERGNRAESPHLDDGTRCGLAGRCTVTRAEANHGVWPYGADGNGCRLAGTGATRGPQCNCVRWVLRECNSRRESGVVSEPFGPRA